MYDRLSLFLNLIIAFTHPEMTLEEYNHEIMLELTKIIPSNIKYEIYNKAERIRNENKYRLKKGFNIIKKNYTL